MDVIGFLCVSLGSSTIQLHDSLGSRCTCAYSEAGFSSQNGDNAWVYYRRVAFCCAFLWAKGLSAKVILKEMFPVYVRKCLSCKVFHNWVVNVSLMTEVKTEVTEATVKRLLCCRFRRTGKVMQQVYECWWRIYREINDPPPPPRFEYHMFCILYPFMTCLLTVLRTITIVL
jgi:hypothetical protein